MNDSEKIISATIVKLLETKTAEEVGAMFGASKPTVLSWAKSGAVQKAVVRRQILDFAAGRESEPKEGSESMMAEILVRLGRIELLLEQGLGKRGSPPSIPSHVKRKIGKKRPGATGTDGI